MLFVTRSGVIKQAAYCMTLTLRTVEVSCGIPKGFWHDPNILGFLAGCLSGHISIASNDKYKGQLAEEISADVFERLVGGGRGIQLQRRVLSMLSQPDFEERFKAGVFTVLIARYGHEAIEDEPIVASAVAMAKKFADAVAQSRGPIMTVVGAIQQRYFFDEVMKLHEAEPTGAV